MTPKRAIAYLFKYMAKLLPSNRLWLFGAQKTRAEKKKKKKKSRTYPKSADPKITPKGTLTYPMRYMAQFLSGVTSDVSNHKNLSAD